MRTRFFVGEVADSVIRRNEPYYTTDLVGLISDDLLNTEFTFENTFELGNQLDELRFQKERELAAILPNPEDLAKILNSPLNTLPPDQEQKRKEIKFLFNVAATMEHW